MAKVLLVEDDFGGSDSLDITLSITPVNDPPFIVGDPKLMPGDTLLVNEDDEIIGVILTDLFDDVDIETNGDQLTYFPESSDTTIAIVSVDQTSDELTIIRSEFKNINF